MKLVCEHFKNDPLFSCQPWHAIFNGMTPGWKCIVLLIIYICENCVRQKEMESLPAENSESHSSSTTRTNLKKQLHSLYFRFFYPYISIRRFIFPMCQVLPEAFFSDIYLEKKKICLLSISQSCPFFNTDICFYNGFF